MELYRPWYIDHPPSVSSEEEMDEVSSEEEMDEVSSEVKVDEEEEDPAEDEEEEEEEEAEQNVAESPSPQPSDSGSDTVGDTVSDSSSDEKNLFQSMWSEDEEIALLEGMVDYASQKGSFPTAAADVNEFLDSMKKSIQFVDFTESELADKLRRLKQRFESKDYDLTTTHDKRLFELSGKIWGSGSPETPAPKTNGLSTQGGAADEELSAMVDSMIQLPKVVVSRGLKLIPEEKKAEIMAEWEKIRLAEMEIAISKDKLLSQLAALMAEALKQLH